MYNPSPKRYSAENFNYLPDCGLALPTISLGLWQNFGSNADYDEIRDIILTAFDNGITHFDLANNYGPAPGSAEINFGKILKNDLMPYRDELVISTKAGYEMWAGPYGGKGGSRKYLTASLDQSLKRLGLEYVDIFYHHCMTPETPLHETALCLSDIVRQGKSLYVGLSNYDGKTMHRMNHRLEDYNVPFVINQNRYNILDRAIEENGLKEQSEKKEKGIIAFSPLAQGRLSDKYKNGIPEGARLYNKENYCKHIGYEESQQRVISALCDIAHERGETLSQTAIKWLLKKGVTSVLIGVRTKAQLLENLKANDGAPLSDEEEAAIDRISKY
ncbi:MAG: aldo/keto reductase [Eubacterium sp.]|nr:aldo/keto reductase [Eubacterium sp.]